MEITDNESEGIRRDLRLMKKTFRCESGDNGRTHCLSKMTARVPVALLKQEHSCYCQTWSRFQKVSPNLGLVLGLFRSY